MTGVARNTVMSLLFQIGTTCAIYQDSALRNLPSKRVQCDEIWSFCYGKDKNVSDDKKNAFGYGSIWTGTALDADTKLICSRMVGNRDAFAAREFVQDLVGTLAIVRNASEIVVQAKIRECLTRANPLILLAE